MTISRLVREHRPNTRAGSNGSWRIETGLGDNVYQLWHYGTLMLTWQEDEQGYYATYLSTGHGSVSDQQGMNTAFAELSLPYRYTRRGGATIVNKYSGEVRA